MALLTVFRADLVERVEVVKDDDLERLDGR